MKENIKVYERIIELCNREHISVRRLERDLCFSNGSIKSMRDSKISSARLQQIAEYFNVTMEYLMTGKKSEYYTNDEAAQIAQEIFENPTMRILFDASRKVSPDNLEFLAEMAKKLEETNPEG